MDFEIKHMLTMFIPADADFDLIEQEALRIGDEMKLDVTWFNSTPASLPYIEAIGGSEKMLRVFHHRVSDFYLFDE